MSSADIEDALQEIAAKLWEVALDPDHVRSAKSYSWSVARSAAADYASRQGRHGRAPAVEWLDELPAPATSPDYESTWAELEQHASDYAELAAARATNRSSRAREQVLSWFYLRVEGRPGPDIAELLGLAAEKSQLVWKWAERGRAIVSALAAHDGDASRGEIMRRLIEGSERVAA